jgi:hypothetical protein
MKVRHLPMPTVEEREMQLYTARYQEFLPEWGVPVRSTLGNVRFSLPTGRR